MSLAAPPPYSGQRAFEFFAGHGTPRIQVIHSLTDPGQATATATAVTLSLWGEMNY